VLWMSLSLSLARSLSLALACSLALALALTCLLALASSRIQTILGGQGIEGTNVEWVVLPPAHPRVNLGDACHSLEVQVTSRVFTYTSLIREMYT
jgi:hypothetical protein